MKLPLLTLPLLIAITGEYRIDLYWEGPVTNLQVIFRYAADAKPNAAKKRRYDMPADRILVIQEPPPPGPFQVWFHHREAPTQTWRLMRPHPMHLSPENTAINPETGMHTLMFAIVPPGRDRDNADLYWQAKKKIAGLN